MKTPTLQTPKNLLKFANFDPAGLLLLALLCFSSFSSPAQSVGNHEKIIVSPENDMTFGGTRIGNRIYLSLVNTEGYIFSYTSVYSTLYKYDLELNPVDSIDVADLLGFDSGASNRIKAFGDSCFVNIVKGVENDTLTHAITVIDTNLNIQEIYNPDFGSDTLIRNLEDALLTKNHLIVVGSGYIDTTGDPAPLYLVFRRSDGQMIHANFLTRLQFRTVQFSAIVRYKNKYVVAPTSARDSTGPIDPVTINSDFTLDSMYSFTPPYTLGFINLALFKAGGTLRAFGKSFAKKLAMVEFDSSLAVSRADTYSVYTSHTIVFNNHFTRISDTTFVMVGSQDPALFPSFLDSTDTRDIVLYKVGASGTVLCSNTIPGENYYFPMHVISAPNGGAYIFSNKYDHDTFANNKTDLSVIKVDGNCQLEKFLSVPSYSTSTEPISVYPNPTSCALNLSGIAQNENLHLKVFNNQGSCVAKRHLGLSRDFALCEVGAPGMYILHILDEDNAVLARKKVMLE